jgi:hypothetical protein
VDLQDPLTGFADRIDSLLDGLQLRSGYFLAALLHLRAA